MSESKRKYDCSYALRGAARSAWQKELNFDVKGVAN